MSASGRLQLAVVGHTNTGKTSLIRTLTRDESFGEVSDHPGVTRDVVRRSLFAGGEPVVDLYDTPGLEDSIGLMEALDRLREGRRTDGPALLEAFLESPDARERFAQEAKALRQVMRSDAGLYVVDVRDAVHAKHRDELAILSWCGRPLIPVLNFTAHHAARPDEWREALRRVNLHAVADFDTVVRTPNSERELFQKMRTLLDDRRETLDALVEDRRQGRERLIDASAREIGEAVVDVAALVLTADQREQEAASEELKRLVREREQRCARRLMELHRFSPDELVSTEMPDVEGRWGMDLFNPETQKRWGVRAGGGAAAGALAGLTVDAVLHGASLGLGAAIGAVLGAASTTGPLTGRRLLNRARGLRELRVGDAVLRSLCARQVVLVRALLARGHAAQQPVALDAEGASALQRRLGETSKAARVARAHPEWSAIAPTARPGSTADPDRDACARRLGETLRPLIERDEGAPSG